MNKIAIYLNRHLSGNVFDNDSILEAYSTDHSMIRIKPRFVALPETTSDIRKIIRFVSQLAEKEYQLPIAIRGSGLSKTGADLTDGLVISMEKMNHIREIDAHDRLVHVQAGITIGELNTALAPHGLTLPIDTNPKETIGSLIANATRDKFSKHYGGIMNYVDRAEIVLANGDLIQTSKLNVGKLNGKKNEKTFEGEIYRKLDKLLLENDNVIAEQEEDSRLGYCGSRYVRRNHGHIFDLLPIFFGSEGTLGVITEVIIRAEVLPPRPQRLFTVFSTIKAATEFANSLENFNPLSVELFDTRIFKTADNYGKKPKLLSRKFDNGYLVLASFNDKPTRAKRKIQHILRLLPKTAYVVAESTQNSSNFDDFTSCVVNYFNNSAKGERPNLLHDFFVPKANLESFLKDLSNLGKTTKQVFALLGSYATNNYSLQPEFNLKEINDRRMALTLLRDFNELLKKHGGCLAGGLPEGRLKPVVIYPNLNPNQKRLIGDIKNIFDPRTIFANGVKSSFDTRSAVRHLRTEPIQDIIS